MLLVKSALRKVESCLRFLKIICINYIHVIQKSKDINSNGSYILIVVFSAPDQEEDEQAEDEDHKAEEDARYGAHHHVAGAGVSGLVRGAVALGVAFVPVTPVSSTTLKRINS